MNTHITSILPNKPLWDEKNHPDQRHYDDGYRCAIDDCAASIYRAVKEGTLVITDGVSDLVRCPTEEEIIYMMYDRDAMGTKTWEKKPEEIAKALLALLNSSLKELK